MIRALKSAPVGIMIPLREDVGLAIEELLAILLQELSQRIFPEQRSTKTCVCSSLNARQSSRNFWAAMLAAVLRRLDDAAPLSLEDAAPDADDFFPIDHSFSQEYRDTKGPTFSLV